MSKIISDKLELNLLPQSFIPTQIQHCILMASISDFEIAKQNWELVKLQLKIDATDTLHKESTTLAQIYDKLDSASNRLLPMLYKNLQRLDDPLLQSIKSFYRYTWAKNHYFYQQLKNITEMCSKLKVDVTMLKGLSTAFYYADDPAIRVMEDIDILIPPQKANIVLDFLRKKYKSKLPYRFAKLLHLEHAATFMVDKSEIDIHWSLFHDEAKLDIYKYDCTSKVAPETNLYVLSADYAFFHAITHGVKPNYIPSIRWISDCYLIQKKHKINWDKIITLAIEFNYIESLRVAIEILPTYSINIPHEVIEQVKSLPLNPHKINYWLKENDIFRKQRSIKQKIRDKLELISLEYKCYRRGVLWLLIIPFYHIKRMLYLRYTSKL